MSPPKSIGRYQIIDEIGRGAMGIVYRATDPNIGRTVALKTMRVDVHGADEEEILLRFKHEAKLAGTMSHPNIVTVHDAGEDAGVFFMAMEFLEGVTLHSVLKERRVLELQRVIQIAHHIGPGLDYAHVHGVIHRDIKPANIMCARDGSIKIMDFGIAKSGAGMTSAGQVLGTPTYMSPEQVRGKTLDGRSDLFSFGVVLYEMVTGEKPFTGQNVTTIIYKIMNEAPIAPRDLDASVHPGVSAVIIKALEKNPDDRYQTAAQLVRDLENFKTVGVDTENIRTIATAGASGAHSAVGEHSSPIITSYETSSFTEINQPVRSEPQTTTKMPGSMGGPGVETGNIQPLPDSDAVLQSIGSTVLVGDHVKGNGRSSSKTSNQMFTRKIGIVAAIILLLAAVIAGRSIKRTSTAKIAASAPVAAATTQGQPSSDGVIPATSKPSAAKPVATAGAAKPAATQSGKSKPAVMAAKSASIVLNSTPAGAAIILDKKETGKVTPATLKLEAGHHEITLHKEFFHDAGISPTLKPGETFNFALTMEPQKSGGGNPFRAIKGIFGGQKIPAGKGLVQIKTKPPGAEIIYKGSSIEQKTPVKLPLDPGSYSIQLKLDGYRTGQKEFTVAQGKSTAVNVELQRK